MHEEERGAAVGRAVLIIAVVAAAIFGGLYLVTQLQSSAPEKFSLTVSKEGTGHVVLEPEGGVYEKGEDFMEEQLEEVNEIFAESVAEARDLDEDEEVFEGKPYLGRKAKEAGLIDRLGGRNGSHEGAYGRR